MRKLFIIITALLFWGFSIAQCINNGALNATCVGDGYNTSNLCVNNWSASHGTPTVMGTPNTNTWAWLWSHSNKGEGIMTNYNFQMGQSYQISFRVRATTNNSNPNSTVLNSMLYVRATSGLSSTDDFPIPTPSSVQNIWTSTVSSTGSNWRTITTTFIPNSNYTQLWMYPLMTAPSGSNGDAQIQMEVDDIAITPPVTSVFHFQNANGTQKTEFCPGENIYLNGTASNGEIQYYIDVWRRPIGNTAAFQWQTRLGASGWTNGQLGVINLSYLFGIQNYNFAPGFEYQVKVATAFPPCVNWVETNHTFKVLNNTGSPAFTYTNFCAANGTISVTANATDTTPGLNHWWGLFETNAAGATSDAATIGQVGAIQMGNTVTFTGLTNSKNYYIKHGVYNSCVSWNEQRTALPQSVSWANYTTNFNLAILAANNGSVAVTATAHNNPVFVNHHWSIFEAPNGNTTGNTGVAGNPDQCCGNASATFSTNLSINHWYYIKHGIWNNCSSWNETRKAFRVVIQGMLPSGAPDYAIEEGFVNTGAKQVTTTETAEEIVKIFPNPMLMGQKVSISNTNVSTIENLQLIDFTGNTVTVPFVKADENTVEIVLKNNLKPGIYTLKITKKSGNILTKKVIVK